MSTYSKGVLILSNDLLTPFAKTSDYMAEALERLGIPAYVRDSAEARLMTYVYSGEMEKGAAQAIQIIDETFGDLINFAEIDTILSLDLNWFIAPGLFIDHPQVRGIHSYWFDDFRSWCTAPMNPCFPVEGNEFQRHIKHPKVIHHFYGNSQAQEAQLLGVINQRVTRLAAPRHLIETQTPCEKMDRLAFIGNPGFRGPPHPEALQMIAKGAELAQLREFCRDAILLQPDVHAVEWFKEEPSLHNLLSVAVEARRQFPYQPAMQILQLVGNHYPRAFEYMNEKGIGLDVAFLIKLVNRYDRPAFVHRLWQHGLVDVYSAADEWQPYGVQALPYICFGDLPDYYRKYMAHLNAPNSIRDATANEKLFEIAASGRLSINLDSPDVRSCYGESEVAFVSTLEELEVKVRALLKDPDSALDLGEAARQRTAREHLWDHRMASVTRM